MKNKKFNEKKNKQKSNINELNNLTGKRRKGESNDIIINKNDIYSILNDLGYDVNYKIPKRKISETTFEQAQGDKESEKFIKTESYSLEINEQECDGSNSMNENLIKKEECSSIESQNLNQIPSAKRSLLNLILSEEKLIQFSEITPIFQKEIESPFTLDYFMKVKEILKSEDKDRVINTLIFLAWSLKFMRIDMNQSVAKITNTIINKDSFSLLANNSNINRTEVNTENYSNSNPYSSNIFGQYMPIKNSDGNIEDMSCNPNIMINKFMNNWSNTLNNINKDPQADVKQANKEIYPQNFIISPLQGFNSYIPVNLISAVPLINSPTFCLTNSNNIIQNKGKHTSGSESSSKEIKGNSHKLSTEASHYSFSDSRITLDSLINNCVEANDHSQNKNHEDLPFKNQEQSDKTVKELNNLNIKKEYSYIDITTEEDDDQPKIENFDRVYCAVIKIFSRPINDETFKLLKNYLNETHVDKIQEIIKKNPFSLKKKQYILLCKKDKEALYLKYDPVAKKYSISRTFYKSK